MPATSDVCVIIAAKNASATIGRAVASALAEPETTELVVLDDGSTDTTAAAAEAVDDGSGRLKIIRFSENQGPAAARNHAIAHSRASLLAVLDADDFFLPGRFQRLFREANWDFIADNIVFVDEAGAAQASRAVPRFQSQARLLDLKGFIEGNISRRGKQRGEIGFLKPVMRRSFLDAHGLRYQDSLRLGEDYDLYARALARGARYKIVHGCGYGAVVRHDSLSGSHRTDDLKRLFEADRAMLADPTFPADAARLIHRHERHIRGRYELRHFLDLKKARGPGAALGYMMARPGAIPAIVGGILADKTERFRPRQAAAPADAGTPAFRYLLPATPEPDQQ